MTRSRALILTLAINLLIAVLVFGIPIVMGLMEWNKLLWFAMRGASVVDAANRDHLPEHLLALGAWLFLAMIVYRILRGRDDRATLRAADS